MYIYIFLYQNRNKFLAPQFEVTKFSDHSKQAEIVELCYMSYIGDHVVFTLILQDFKVLMCKALI